MVNIIPEILCFGFLFGLLTWQSAAAICQTLDKNKKYKTASAFAVAAGKPLLVASGPFGINRLRHFFKVRAHGHGDVCFDITPKALHNCPCRVVADVRHIPFRDKSFGAVFTSHLLEHLPSITDAEQALSELDRVAEAVFIAYPNKHWVVSWLIPDHYLWVWQKGDKIYLKQRKSQ